MTIPKYHELFTTVLQELADGREWRSRDFQQHVVDGMDLSEEERSEKYGGGGNRALAASTLPANISIRLARYADRRRLTGRLLIWVEQCLRSIRRE